MKKLVFPLIALLIAVISACSTKFNIAAPYKNITLVYGFLDMADTAHYIRIQKAFLDQNKSAVTMAQTPDSSYYASLNVRINRIGITDNLLFDTIHLNRVDLDLEGYPKQPGAFFTAPNYAYKFKNKLDQQFIYRIIVQNNATGEIDSADAPVIDDLATDIDPLTTVPYLTSGIFSDTATIDFASTQSNQNVNIYGNYSGNFTFENLPTPAVVADMVFQFNWIDSNVSSHTSSYHSYSFDLGYDQLITTYVTGQIIYTIPDKTFYSALWSGMQKAPTDVIRILDKSTVYIYLGTQDFMNYVANQQVQGTGLTGSEIEPIYTNVKGANVLGIYTSRGVRAGAVKISYITVDSLQLNTLTAPCNIRGTTY